MGERLASPGGVVNVREVRHWMEVQGFGGCLASLCEAGVLTEIPPPHPRMWRRFRFNSCPTPAADANRGLPRDRVASHFTRSLGRWIRYLLDEFLSLQRGVEAALDSTPRNLARRGRAAQLGLLLEGLMNLGEGVESIPPHLHHVRVLHVPRDTAGRRERLGECLRLLRAVAEALEEGGYDDTARSLDGLVDAGCLLPHFPNRRG